MKSLITNIIAAAALSLTDPALSNLHDPADASAAATSDDDPNLTGALDDAQQVELELAARLDSAAARAAAQDTRGRRQTELVQTRRALALAQATPAVPVAKPTPAPAQPGFQDRLQKIVGRAHGGAAKSLVVRTSETDGKAQAKLEEDLAVMSRILDKKLAEINDDKPHRAMGIDVFFAPGANPIRSLYLEGYGALFMLGVNFPLLAPPEKTEPAKEKSETDSTWDEARRELYGSADGMGHDAKAFTFAFAGEPPEDYDEQKVADLKESLLDVLKNATNIRTLKPEEAITVCVFGGATAAPKKARTVWKRNSDPSDDVFGALVAVDRDDRTSGRGTVMTIHVKKADVDAFAKGKLSAEEFHKKAAITAYPGDAAGWGAGYSFSFH